MSFPVNDPPSDQPSVEVDRMSLMEGLEETLLDSDELHALVLESQFDDVFRRCGGIDGHHGAITVDGDNDVVVGCGFVILSMTEADKTSRCPACLSWASQRVPQTITRQVSTMKIVFWCRLIFA